MTRDTSYVYVFKPDRSKTVCLLQFFFVCASVVISYVAFGVSYFFLISPTFGASGGLCFLTVINPGVFTYIICISFALILGLFWRYS